MNLHLQLNVIIYIILLLALLISCKEKGVKPPLNENNLLGVEGKYLVDDVYFPQDTLVLNKFKPSDSTTLKKLLVELKNDSIYLDNYNFGGFYGKWFVNFHTGKANFENNKLRIHAKHAYYRARCENDSTWQKIEYTLTKKTDSSITFIKTLDSTNCISNSVFKYLGRGGRQFEDEPIEFSN